MADFSAVTEADVKLVYIVEQYTLPAAEAIVAGQAVGIEGVQDCG